jgi:hypothetical protein
LLQLGHLSLTRLAGDRLALTLAAGLIPLRTGCIEGMVRSLDGRRLAIGPRGGLVGTAMIDAIRSLFVSAKGDTNSRRANASVLRLAGSVINTTPSASTPMAAGSAVSAMFPADHAFQMLIAIPSRKKPKASKTSDQLVRRASAP